MTSQQYFIVAGLDGTGSMSWRREDCKNSHVCRFQSDLATSPRLKLPEKMTHGPSTDGHELWKIIPTTYEWIVQRMEELIRTAHCSQEDIHICLVGHSRGCIAAMGVADALGGSNFRIAVSPSLRSPITVDYLGLYDTVDRAPYPRPRTLLPNVKLCYHAVREHISVDPERGSRGSFGTVEVQQAIIGNNVRYFDTSHGGIGGDPGFFTPLGLAFKDYYCNALQAFMSQSDLTRYGVDVNAAALLGRVVPLYPGLEGMALSQRLARLKGFYMESVDADRFIRAGAERAGFRFHDAARGSVKLEHLPFGVSESKLWGRLNEQWQSYAGGAVKLP